MVCFLSVCLLLKDVTATIFSFSWASALVGLQKLADFHVLCRRSAGTEEGKGDDDDDDDDDYSDLGDLDDLDGDSDSSIDAALEAEIAAELGEG